MFKLPSINASLKALHTNKIEILFSFIFTVILVLGHLLSAYESIDVTFGWVRVLLYIAGSTVVWCIILLGLIAMRKRLLRTDTSAKALFMKNLSDKKLWILASLAIFICYLPVILTSASVLTPDSWSSIKQATGEAPLSNAHPVIFTAFTGIFIQIGLLFGSFEFGILLFSLVQSAILAMIFALAIVWMRREKIGRSGIIATFLFYAILPINAIAGIIMWKDILFAGFGLLLLILLRQLYLEKDGYFTKKNVLCFVLIAFLFCAWRNNGFYSYAVMSLLVIAIGHKTFFKKKYLLLMFSPIILFFIYSGLTSLVSSPGPKTVMFSVPLQQIARTVKYHGASISEEDKEAINEILPFDQLGAKYNPNLADPVLWTFDVEAFDQNQLKYLGLWLRLFVDHTKTFIAAFAYNSYGYVYPYFPSSTTTDVLLDNDTHFNASVGYVDGAYESKGKLALAAYRDLITSAFPLVRNIGFYTCLILLGAYLAIIKRKHELIGVFALLFCLFLTTILGPVNGEFRYLYLFTLATPFILAAVYSNNHKSARKG